MQTSELVKRLRAATMRPDWGDLPDDAAIPAIPLLREAADALTAQAAMLEEMLPNALPTSELVDALDEYIAGNTIWIPARDIRAALIARAGSIEDYYARQIEWSLRTFGPGTRTKGVLDHIRKELCEIEDQPDDLSEWVDVIILAMDGFWRNGGSAHDLMPRLLAKQVKNFARKWPDWRTMSEDHAIEHDRSGETIASNKAGGDRG